MDRSIGVRAKEEIDVGAAEKVLYRGDEFSVKIEMAGYSSEEVRDALETWWGNMWTRNYTFTATGSTEGHESKTLSVVFQFYTDGKITMSLRLVGE